MNEWGEMAEKLLIQKVDIYDRCPSLDIVLVTILDCYMDVASSRTQDGHIPWDNIYLWCTCNGVSKADREFYLDAVKSIDKRILKWQRAGSTSENTPPKRQLP